jgi:tetratricopeptide (TPR) repeat protein
LAIFPLENGAWQKANEYFEKALSENVEEARAYLGRLMAELKYKTENDFVGARRDISEYDNFIMANQFADDALKAKLNDFALYPPYNNATDLYKKADDAKDKNDYAYALGNYVRAAKFFGGFEEFKDSKKKKTECENKYNELLEAIYNEGCEKMQSVDISTDLSKAKSLFDLLAKYNYKNSVTLSAECSRAIDKREKYVVATNEFAKKNYDTAIELFKKLGSYRDSEQKVEECVPAQNEIFIILPLLM